MRGVVLRTWKNAPPTLREVLEASRAHGDAEFLVYDAEVPGAVAGPFDRLTFAAHLDAAAAFARHLIDDVGIQVGDRVCIAMRNFPEWSIAFWGAAVAGAVVVPLNAWWTGPELAYGLSDSGSRVLVADRQRAERIADHRGELPALERTLVVRAGPAGPPPGTVAFEEAIGAVRPGADLPAVAIGPEDDATIFYTSGTTGQPKGALGHAPQHLHEPGQPRLLRGADGGAVGATPDPGAAPAAQRVPAVGPVLPRHRLPLRARRQPGRRRRDRDHAPVGRRAGAAADRARAGHDLRRRPGDGVAGARAPGLRALRPVVREGDRLRRRPGRPRAGAPPRGDVPWSNAVQRVRAHRDLVGDDDERRPRLPGPTGQRRRPRARLRPPGRRPRREDRCPRARSASCGSRDRTS